MTDRKGRLFGLGVGPGDPELITVKALRLLRAAPVIAYPVAKGKKSYALTIIENYLQDAQIRLPLIYPVTEDSWPPPFCYESVLSRFYDDSASEVAVHLENGQDVAVVCEGDPFFYGSFMYLHDRLAERYQTTVIPGVCSVTTCASVLGTPLVYRNQVLTILSGVLSEEDLKQRLAQTDAAAVMKLGRHFEKVRRVLLDLGLMNRALYIERATMAQQRIAPLAEVEPDGVPYFAMILVPGQRWNAP
ncbi:Precorrin-2 C(20)-methyltransferase [Azospirillaceae bacterium]